VIMVKENYERHETTVTRDMSRGRGGPDRPTRAEVLLRYVITGDCSITTGLFSSSVYVMQGLSGLTTGLGSGLRKSVKGDMSDKALLSTTAPLPIPVSLLQSPSPACSGTRGRLPPGGSGWAGGSK